MFCGLEVVIGQPSYVEKIVEWCTALKPTETRPSQLAWETFTPLPSFMRFDDFNLLLRPDNFKSLLEQKWKDSFEWLVKEDIDSNLNWMLRSQCLLLHITGSKGDERQYFIIGCCTDLTQRISRWYLWPSALIESPQSGYVSQIVEWCSELKPTKALPNKLASHLFTEFPIEPDLCFDYFKALLEKTWQESFEWLVTNHIRMIRLNSDWMLRSRRHLLHLRGIMFDTGEYVIFGSCTDLMQPGITSCWCF